jgi:hypothetical protein
MINITVRPKSYTREELKEMYSKYSENDADFNEFIAAMVKTDQLAERRGAFYPTQVTTETQATKQTREFTAILYGGKKRARYQRVAIRSLKSDLTRTDPTKMHVTAYQDKGGKWHSVSERPSLTLVAPRESERWRANIPAEIAKKYNIRVSTPIRVRVEGTTKHYFSQLTLWGYLARGIISFGETHKHQEDRHLEIRADDFAFEVKGPIRTEMKTAGEKIISITRKWLEIYDKQYAEYYGNSIITETGPHTGVDYATPLTRPMRRTSTITFEDLDKGANLGEAEGTLARNWQDKADENSVGSFFLVQDRVVHGYKGRDRTFRVKGKKTGTTTVHKSTPYSLKQTTLNLPNQPGFKRKK